MASVLPPTCRVMLMSAAGLAVAGHDADVILGSRPDGRDVADAQAAADDDVRDVVDRVRLARRHDQVLLVVLRHAADGAHRRRGLNRRRHVGERHLLHREPRRIGDDLDLAHVAALHVDAADAGHARDQRLDLVARDVVQRGRIAALEIVRENRKDRRRQSLDFDVEIGRQIVRDSD